MTSTDSTASQTHRIRVGVLYGGRSGEHEVSLRSAASIIQHLDPAKFTVIPIGITREGCWVIDPALQNSNTPILSLESPCLSKNHLLIFDPASLHRPVNLASIPASLQPEVIFPAVHGTCCEDGTLQGLLEQAEIAYAGCGVLASAIGMEKDVAKRLARDAGIPVAPFLTFRQHEWAQHPEKVLARAAANLHFPVFVKPANTGSSVGVSKVIAAEQLAAAIENAFACDSKILVEQGIDALELEVAVLESPEDHANPTVSIVGEIRPHPAHGFYSYAAKYLDEHGAELLVPAQSLDAETTARVTRMAKKIFIQLECEGMARVDLFMERATGSLWFNEINTLPGFTAISMYPRLMAASGISTTELLTRLIALALQRHARKSKLARAFQPTARTAPVTSE